jgi:hypothetical protein
MSAAHGRQYRGKLAGDIAQAEKPLPAIHANQNDNGRGVVPVFRLRDQDRPDLFRAVSGKPFQGFLPVPEGHALDGQLEAAGFHDYPGADKGGASVLAFRGQPVPKAHYLAFHFPVCHGHHLLSLYSYNIKLLSEYVKHFITFFYFFLTFYRQNIIYKLYCGTGGFYGHGRKNPHFTGKARQYIRG